ncbi:MAG: hypothetical protein ABI851_13205 [Saprospiraceae bacterium]
MKNVILFLLISIQSIVSISSQNSVLFKEIQTNLKNTFSCSSCQFDLHVKLWHDENAIIPDKQFDVKYKLKSNAYYVSFSELTYINTSAFKLLAIHSNHTLFLDVRQGSNLELNSPIDLDKIALSFDTLGLDYKITKKELNQLIVYDFSYPTSNPIRSAYIYFNKLDGSVNKILYNYNEDYKNEFPNRSELVFTPLKKLDNESCFQISTYLSKVGSHWKGRNQLKDYNIETTETYGTD